MHGLLSFCSGSIVQSRSGSFGPRAELKVDHGFLSMIYEHGYEADRFIPLFLAGVQDATIYQTRFEKLTARTTAGSGTLTRCLGTALLPGLLVIKYLISSCQ